MAGGRPLIRREQFAWPTFAGFAKVGHASLSNEPILWRPRRRFCGWGIAGCSRGRVQRHRDARPLPPDPPLAIRPHVSPPAVTIPPLFHSPAANISSAFLRLILFFLHDVPWNLPVLPLPGTSAALPSPRQSPVSNRCSRRDESFRSIFLPTTHP